MKLAFTLNFIYSIFALFRMSYLNDDLEMKYSKNKLVMSLIYKNLNLFNQTQQSEFFEKQLFKEKFKAEIMLRQIIKSYGANNLSLFLNEIIANYLHDFLINKSQSQTLSNYNDTRTSKQLNLTIINYCNANRKKCLTECMNKNMLENSFIRDWCVFAKYNIKYKRHITEDPVKTNEMLLLDEIVKEQKRKNLSKHLEFLKLLSDSLFTSPNAIKSDMKTCELGYLYDERNDECMDINECENDLNINYSTYSSLNRFCDINAYCINTKGSFKCVCKKGFIGDGTNGNCFNGKFCSGRYCRLNGECFYKNNLNGYKCRCMLDCLNGGKCVMSRYKYECKCPINLTGLLCNETVNYYLFKKKYTDTFNTNNNSSDFDLLNNLVSFVQPSKDNDDMTKTNIFKVFNNSNEMRNFEMLNFFYLDSEKTDFKKETSYLKNKFKQLKDLDYHDYEYHHHDHHNFLHSNNEVIA